MSAVPLFTIVLVGHQSAPYLPRALESIMRQSVRDFEVLCFVEDSVDESLSICQAQAKSDSRFTVMTGLRTGGGGASRNYAIRHAKGRYLVSLDGDDWLADGMLERLATRLKAMGDVDVLAFEAAQVDNESVDMARALRFTNFGPSDAGRVFSGLEAIRLSGRNRGRFHSHTWLSVYRIEFLRQHGLYQLPGIYEDYEWAPRVWFFAKRFSYLDETLYYYRHRSDSILAKSTSESVFALAEKIYRLMDFACSQAVPKDVLQVWSTQWIPLLFWMLFHPVSSLKLADPGRRKAIHELFKGDGRTHFGQLISVASTPKRVAFPLLVLADWGIMFPVKFYFRWFYYPLVERRGRTCR